MKETEKLLTESGFQESHWGAIIIEAEKDGGFYFTDEEYARYWHSCPCAELGDHIKKDSNGVPCDFDLGYLCLQFYDNIKYQDDREIIDTAKIYIEIEKRSLELLEQSKRAN